VRVLTGFNWLKKGLVVSACEDDDEPSGSIQDWEFLDWLSDYQLLKTDSAP